MSTPIRDNMLIDMSFCHVPVVGLGQMLTPSLRLKENLLAISVEVNQIKTALKGDVDPRKVHDYAQRLIELGTYILVNEKSMLGRMQQFTEFRDGPDYNTLSFEEYAGSYYNTLFSEEFAESCTPEAREKIAQTKERFGDEYRLKKMRNGQNIDRDIEEVHQLCQVGCAGDALVKKICQVFQKMPSVASELQQLPERTSFVDRLPSGFLPSVVSTLFPEPFAQMPKMHKGLPENVTDTQAVAREIQMSFFHFNILGIGSIVTPSVRLKENLLSCFIEVDQIKSDLKKGLQAPECGERLLELYHFFNDQKQPIAKQVHAFSQFVESRQYNFKSFEDFVKEQPFQAIEQLQNQFEARKWSYEHHNDLRAEEVYQLCQSGYACEQLCSMIAHLIHKEPSLEELRTKLTAQAPFKETLPPAFQRALNAMPKMHRDLPEWVQRHDDAALAFYASHFPEESAAPVSSSNMPTCSSSEHPIVSSSAPVCSSSQDVPKPTVTAGITVYRAEKKGEKLFIRGSGPGMSWTKGIEMKQKGGKWVFETTKPFDKAFEYKILLNDKKYEQGANHRIQLGQRKEVRSIRF